MSVCVTCAIRPTDDGRLCEKCSDAHTIDKEIASYGVPDAMGEPHRAPGSTRCPLCDTYIRKGQSTVVKIAGRYLAHGVLYDAERGGHRDAVTGEVVSQHRYERAHASCVDQARRRHVRVGRRLSQRVGP